jgi:hypothetical protein
MLISNLLKNFQKDSAKKVVSVNEKEFCGFPFFVVCAKVVGPLNFVG